jgi:hypothetical protein
MPTLTTKDSIEVRAPVTLIYDLLTEDLLTPSDNPESMTKRRPLDEGPVRPGFRYEQTVIHNRHTCRSEWTVTRADRPGVIEETREHFCAEASKELKGGDRWELRDLDGSTFVTLTAWTHRPGIGGLILKWLGDHSVSKMGVKRRLAYVQFEAERRAKAAEPSSGN